MNLKNQSWPGIRDASTCTISIKISVSDAITTASLSSKVKWYMLRLSLSLRLHGDKFWTPVNDFSCASFSNIIISGKSKWRCGTSRCMNPLNRLIRSALFKSFLKKPLKLLACGFSWDLFLMCNRFPLSACRLTCLDCLKENVWLFA